MAKKKLTHTAKILQKFFNGEKINQYFGQIMFSINEVARFLHEA